MTANPQGVWVDRMRDHQLCRGQEGRAMAMTHHLALGVEGFKVEIRIPHMQLTVPLTDEVCLIAADQVSTLAHWGEVTNLWMRRAVRSPPAADGTLDRIGMPSKGFGLTGYRMRLTGRAEAANVLAALEMAADSGGAQLVMSDASVSLPPAEVPRDLASMLAQLLVELVDDPLISIAVISRKERLSGTQALHLLGRHYPKPGYDASDPLWGYHSLGSYRYAYVVDMLAAAGIPYSRASA